jgi:hypothetical protein
MKRQFFIGQQDCGLTVKFNIFQKKLKKVLLGQKLGILDYVESKNEMLKDRMTANE